MDSNMEIFILADRKLKKKELDSCIILMNW